MLLRSNRQFTPPTDVIELADKLLVMVEIAGMRGTDFDIVLQNRQLTISGSRVRRGTEVAAYHQMEIAYGEFLVEVQLPWAARHDEVTASYEQGLLTVELPRRPAEAVRVVDMSTQKQD